MNPVTSTSAGDVAVIDFDDGKANALSHDAVDGLREALASAVSGSATAIALIGREGRFSAGFDLNVMRTDGALGLMDKGANLALEIFTCPKPVVFGVTGHALAMGAVLLCTPDYRVGAAGDYKLGLNEVRISMPVPPFATELARDRLSPVAFTRAVSLAQIFAPDEAAAAGWLDEVVPTDHVRKRAVEVATELGRDLDGRAFAATRTIARGALADTLAATLR
ncbi:MAG: crotonase/enoyl-CoA hydratase family protein [Acidimicrobiales bacterium]